MNSNLAADWRTAYACGALRIVETLMVSLSSTPLLRLLESSVCQRYYRQHDPAVIPASGSVPEELCKDSNVQSLISSLNGTDTVLALLPALLAAIPYLSLDQQSNKRRTLLINAVGTLSMTGYYVLILSFDSIFDPRWMWLRGIFSFIAGGDLVYYSLVHAIIAESVPQTKLSSFYMYTTAMALVMKILGSSASLSIMNISLWLPIAMSFGVKMIGMLIIWAFLPEPTLNHKEGPDGIQLMAEYENDSVDEQPKPIHSSKSLFSRHSIVKHMNTIWKYRQHLGVYSFQDVGLSYRAILPFWLSRRYKWTLRQTGWVLMVEMLVTALIVAIAPRCFKYIHKGHIQDRDIALAKMCLGFSTLGLMILGLAWYKVAAIISLVVIAGGTPFRDAYMGHLTAKLQKQEITEIYIYLAMIQMSAWSVGAWVVAGLDAICLHFENAWWTSTPMWLCSIAFACSALLAG